jgi:uncharacterized protein (TIRG00374 family)
VTKWRNLILGLLLGIILLYVSFRVVDFEAVVAAIKDVDGRLAALAAVFYIAAYFIRSIRWRIILQPVVSIPIGTAFKVFMAGYFLNYIIPVRAGELAKPLFLKRLKGTPVSQTLPTVFIDKLLDLMSIVLVFLVIPFVSVHLSGKLLALMSTILGIFIIAVLILILALANQQLTVKALRKFFFWMPQRFEDRVLTFIELFVEGMSVAKRKKRIMLALLLITGAAVAMDSVYFFTVFRAFSVEIPYLTVLFGYTLIYLSYILPTPPGQIGSNQAVMLLIFGYGLGFDHEVMLAVMVFAHLLTGAIITGVGFLSFGAIGISVGESFRRAEEARDEMAVDNGVA